MRVWAMSATVALLLGGCGSTGFALGQRATAPDRVRGDAEGVRVFGMDSRVDAYPLAIAHCARFGRSAQYAGRAERGHAFRCVAG